MVSALGGITDRTEFFDCEAASRRDIEDAAFAGLCARFPRGVTAAHHALLPGYGALMVPVEST